MSPTNRLFSDSPSSASSDRPTIVGAYMRQSKNDLEGIETQKRIIQEFAARRGYVLPDDPAYWFVDNDVSGVTSDRDAYEQLKQDVAHVNDKRFSIVIARRPDRFGRWRDPRQRLAEELWFLQHNVLIEYTNDERPRVRTADPRDPAFVLQLIHDVFTGLQDGAEVLRLRERVESRRRQYAHQGYWTANRNVPYGTERWLKDTTSGAWLQLAPSVGSLHINGARFALRFTQDGQAEIVAEIYRRVCHGESLAAIATILNDRKTPCPGLVHFRRYKTAKRAYRWRASTLRSLLGNPVYFGALAVDISREHRAGRWRKIAYLPAPTDVDLESAKPVLVRNAVEKPPVSFAQWFEANELLSGQLGAGPRKRRSPAHLLAGMMCCAHCLDRIYVHTEVKRNTYLCYTHSRVGIGFPECKTFARALDARKLDEAVERVVLSALDSDAVLPHVMQTIRSDLERDGAAAARMRCNTIDAELLDIRTRVRQVANTMVEMAGKAMIYDVLVETLALHEARAVQLQQHRTTLAATADRWSIALARLEAAAAARKPLTHVYQQAAFPERRAVMEAVIAGIFVDFRTGTLEVRLRPLAPKLSREIERLEYHVENGIPTEPTPPAW